MGLGLARPYLGALKRAGRRCSLPWPTWQASALGARLSLYLGSNVSCTTLMPSWGEGRRGERERPRSPGHTVIQSSLWDWDGTEADLCFR